MSHFLSKLTQKVWKSSISSLLISSQRLKLYDFWFGDPQSGKRRLPSRFLRLQFVRSGRRSCQSNPSEARTFRRTFFIHFLSKFWRQGLRCWSRRELLLTLWPDWDILKRSWWQIFCPEKPKYLPTFYFGYFENCHIFNQKCSGNLLGNFRGTLGYFLFHNSVTLTVEHFLTIVLRTKKIILIQ